MAEKVIVIGAGGHAGVVADALLAAGIEVTGFTDSNAATHASRLFGIPVLGNDDILERYSPSEFTLANGIGGIQSMDLRQRVQERLEERGWRFCGVVHPRAIVSPFASIGEGVQVLAGAIVQAGVQLAKGCIVNTGAVIEHGSAVAEWVHVAPGAVLCGGVSVGHASHVGARAVIRQSIKLGPQTVVGLGAVVVRDFDGAGVLVGVPARSLREQQ